MTGEPHLFDRVRVLPAKTARNNLVLMDRLITLTARQGFITLWTWENDSRLWGATAANRTPSPDRPGEIRPLDDAEIAWLQQYLASLRVDEENLMPSLTVVKVDDRDQTLLTLMMED